MCTNDRQEPWTAAPFAFGLKDELRVLAPGGTVVTCLSRRAPDVRSALIKKKNGGRAAHPCAARKMPRLPGTVGGV
jgi:hypothetical protein